MGNNNDLRNRDLLKQQTHLIAVYKKIVLDKGATVVKGTKSIRRKRSVRLYPRISPINRGIKEIWG